MRADSLVFVYNADSGAMNTLLDIGHKILSPSTYACRLCALTHSVFTMRDEWRRFVADLGVPVEFLHRDEAAKRYGIGDATLPAVYRVIDGAVRPWIGAEEINACASLEALERLVKSRLESPAPR